MGVVSKLLQRIKGAEGEVARLEETVARLQADVISRQAELADLEARVGDEVVEDETGEAAARLGDEAHRLRSLIDVTGRGVRAAEKKLLTARADVLRAKAAEVRDRASVARRKADAHQAKVEALLRQLKELDNVDYSWHQPEVSLGQLGAGMTYDIPLGDALRNEAAELEDQARVLEARADDTEAGAERPAAAYAAPPTMRASSYT